MSDPDPDHDSRLAKLFASLDAQTLRLNAREGTSIEFKQSFNWANHVLYAKSMAAFSNNRGGYLIFGITNNPRTLVGIFGTGFDDLDEAKVTAYLNGTFSPAIQYEKFTTELNGKKLGIIYVAPHPDSPVVAIKADGDVQEAAIYYRYNARNDRIKYPELKAIFDRVRERERQDWMALIAKVGKIGPSNAGIMDVVEGTIEGAGGTLLIDAALLPKLKFIKEGKLAERGKPVLKLVGDVRPVAVTGNRIARGPLRITDDPAAPGIREEAILQNYPLSFAALVTALRKRYLDFKQDNKFIGIRNSLRGNARFCKMRFLDPGKPKGMRKEFYSEVILSEFDKHYTRHPPTKPPKR